MNVIDYFRLDGKIAIVTGGYSYLGEAFTNALLEAGATVVVAGRDKGKFDDKFQNLKNCFFEPIDIMDSENMKQCFKRVYEKFNSIDILVNNAVTLQGSQFFEEITDEDWNFSMEGVAGCIFKACREITPYMKEKGGVIINIASMYGHIIPDFRIYEGEYRYQFNPIHYGAGKAAVIQMSKYLAEYLIGDKIRVNVISPGPFPSTETQRHKEFIKRLSEKNPMNRIGVPDDLKGAVVFLASDASKYIIGQNIQVDGGWTIW
jgi:gluconate 5-dehydrogenase